MTPYGFCISLSSPPLLMISRMIRAQASVPHEIVRVKMVAACNTDIVEALTRSVSFNYSIWDLP